MSFPVLVDTCVLVPISVADLFLRLAEAKVFRILWSEEILAELERNLVRKIGLTAEGARRRLEAMRDNFPDALVEDYEALTGAMTCDPKDRHVLAAAVRAKAELLVTFNLKDFPPAACKPYEVEVVSPDDFLLDQLDLYPEVVAQCIRDYLRACTHPPIALPDLLATLGRCGMPLFANAVGKRIGSVRPD